MKFFGGVGRGPKNNRLDFGGAPDHNSDPGITIGILELFEGLALGSIAANSGF